MVHTPAAQTQKEDFGRRKYCALQLFHSVRGDVIPLSGAVAQTPTAMDDLSRYRCWSKRKRVRMRDILSLLRCGPVSGRDRNANEAETNSRTELVRRFFAKEAGAKHMS